MLQVASVREGRGDLDMIKDLLSLHLLGKDFEAQLVENKFDLAQLDRALALHEELTNLLARLDISPKRIGESEFLCKQAWTYLWKALEEVYAAGRFVFMDEPEIEELFYIDYLQEVRTSAGATTTLPTPSEDAAPAAA